MALVVIAPNSELPNFAPTIMWGKHFTMKSHSEIVNIGENGPTVAYDTDTSQSSQLRYGFSMILLLSSSLTHDAGSWEGIDEGEDGVVWDRGTEETAYRMLATLPSLITSLQLCC